MISKARWTVECHLMANNFPDFDPFATEDGTIGFEGTLRGPRSSRMYTIVLKAKTSTYPESAPTIYITPRPEPHHYYWPDGRLDVCYQWNPTRSCFVSMTLVAARYIIEFDGKEEKTNVN